METSLLRTSCLAAAVAFHEKGIEREMVARILAADERVQTPTENAPPETTAAYRAFWRQLYTLVMDAAKAHGLVT